jgi:hypothetical protein
MFILFGNNFRKMEETPQGSFLKYKAPESLKTLKQNGTSKLYEVNAIALVRSCTTHFNQT